MANDKKIKSKLNNLGFETYNKERKENYFPRILPPTIIGLLIERYIDPDELDYEKFIEEFEIEY